MSANPHTSPSPALGAAAPRWRDGLTVAQFILGAAVALFSIVGGGLSSYYSAARAESNKATETSTRLTAVEAAQREQREQHKAYLTRDEFRAYWESTIGPMREDIKEIRRRVEAGSAEGSRGR